jgi:hypothetical protein
MTDSHAPQLSLFARLWMALACFFSILFNRQFAAQVQPIFAARREPAQLPASTTHADRAHASGLFLLSLLQREGRLIDFLQEDIAAASDAQIGAAARVVHEGCRNVLRQYLALEPVMREPEGTTITVPEGFDARRIRLVGNVAGEPPFSGSLKHHGWVTRDVRLPSVPEALDANVIAPAEVELP